MVRDCRKWWLGLASPSDSLLSEADWKSFLVLRLVTRKVRDTLQFQTFFYWVAMSGNNRTERIFISPFRADVISREETLENASGMAGESQARSLVVCPLGPVPGKTRLLNSVPLTSCCSGTPVLDSQSSSIPVALFLSSRSLHTRSLVCSRQAAGWPLCSGKHCLLACLLAVPSLACKPSLCCGCCCCCCCVGDASSVLTSAGH